MNKFEVKWVNAMQDCSPASGWATKNESWGRGACSLNSCETKNKGELRIYGNDISDPTKIAANSVQRFNDRRHVHAKNYMTSFSTEKNRHTLLRIT